MALGTDQMTITTGANFIPEIWSKVVQKAVENNLVLANLVSRFDDDVAEYGDTVHIPVVSNISANAKSANTQVTLNAPTEGKVDISINRHYESSFLVEKILAKQSRYSHQKLYSQKAGYAIAKQIETDLVGLGTGLSQIVGTAGSAITDATIVAGIVKLDEADAPEADRSFVISPAAKGDIIQINKFTSVDFVEGKPTVKGMLGDIYGLKVFVTNTIAAVGGSPTAHRNLMFHKEAFALAMQQSPEVAVNYIPEYLGWLTTVDAIWGYVEYRDTFGVVVLD